jgi:hypothetical protein
MDFEWLGVGSVRCGFVINEKFIDRSHVQQRQRHRQGLHDHGHPANPVRDHQRRVQTASSSTMKQICSTVISDGGYQQAAVNQYAGAYLGVAGRSPRRSCRLSRSGLASDSLGAVVLAQAIQVFPTTNQNL